MTTADAASPAPNTGPIILPPLTDLDPIPNPDAQIPIQPPLRFSIPPPHRIPHHRKNTNKHSSSSQSSAAVLWKNPNLNPNPTPSVTPKFRSVSDQMPGRAHTYDPATEEQLKEMLLQCLDYYYGEALAKLSIMGYDEKAVLDAVLRSGHCYGGRDVVTNIMHNTIGFLGGGCSEFSFTDLSQLKEYCLADESTKGSRETGEGKKGMGAAKADPGGEKGKQ